MKVIFLKGRPIVPGRVKGSALVSTKPISFLGGVNPVSGIVREREHDLKGKSVKGKVLCFPHGHGSTVGSYVIYSLAKKGSAPKAIINQTADPVIVVGAIIANIPMMDQVDIQQIMTGDSIEVDTDKGLMKITRGIDVSNERRREDF